MVRLTPYIRAVGRHRSGDIWVATATEAGRDVLVETIDRWLLILSKRLWYAHKTYPILIQGFPPPSTRHATVRTSITIS